MQPNIELLQNEEIGFQDERIALTNRRLIGNFGRAGAGAHDEVALGDVGPPNKFNGGQHGRRELGLRLLLVGVGIVALGVLVQVLYGINQRLEAAVFLVGSLSATVGLYLFLNSLFRRAPNTTIIFPVLEGEDIVATYPGWDNPDAEELVRQFARAKRGIGRRRS